MWKSKLSISTYSKISEDEVEWDEEKGTGHKQIYLVRAIILVACCFIAGAAGYLAAEAASKHFILSNTSQALELETIAQTFQYNRSFSYPPSNHTNRAWRDLFPREGGFFIHPTIAPTRSTFSVFHQLHCLNGLRGGYFANQRAASEGRKLTDEDLPVDIRQSHMRHCIDLLRQVLMCQADTTLEVVDESINGVHGFRTVHTCKNWDQLRDWTTEWQSKQHVAQIE